MRLPTIEDLLSYAIEDGFLYGATLSSISPAGTGCVLSTKAPASTVDLLLTSLPELVVTSDVIGMSPEWTCWVMGYQVRQVQHRLFIPLMGEQAHELARSIGQDGLTLLMRAGDLEISYKVPVRADFLTSMHEHHRAWLGSSRASELFLRTCWELMQPPNLRPAEGATTPTTVSVSAVVAADFPLPADLARLRVLSVLRRT